MHIVASSTASPAADKTAVVPPVVDVPETDASGESAEYTLLQKGLFLAVILGCVAVWMKVNSKKAKRYPEKSMA